MTLKQLFAPRIEKQLTDDPYEADVIILFDTSFLAYKSAYALKNLTTKDGRNSGHIFGAVKQILTMLKDHAKGKTACLVFAFDGKPVHRLEIYPEYKAGRVNRLGYNPIADVEVLCANIKGLTLWNNEYEADDIIAAFAHKFNGSADILVFSKDRDLWQLVPLVKIVYDRGELIGEKEVREKFKVSPEQIPIHKAVFGDPSDNIPRIPRVRSAYLLPLVQDAHTPKQFFENLENREKYEIPDKARTAIMESREQVEKNYVLARLVYDMTFISAEGGSIEGLTTILQRFECTSLLDKVKELT